MTEKKKRMSYTAEFKLEAIKYAKDNGNRAAERKYGPTEKMIRDWRKKEETLKTIPKTKRACRGSEAKWPQLGEASETWIVDKRNSGNSVSTKMILCEARKMGAEKDAADFVGNIKWVFQFMKRHGLSMRTKTRLAQKMPIQYEDKILNFHKFVIQLRKQTKVPLCQIGNMDKTAMKFDCPSNRTVDIKGSKTYCQNNWK